MPEWTSGVFWKVTISRAPLALPPSTVAREEGLGIRNRQSGDDISSWMISSCVYSVGPVIHVLFIPCDEHSATCRVAIVIIVDGASFAFLRFLHFRLSQGR